MSSTATGSGNDDGKRKEHHDELLGSTSQNNLKGDAIGVAKKEEAFEPYIVFVQDATEMMIDEVEVEALGLPISEDFVVRSLFDNRSYVGKLCLISLKYRDGDTLLFQLVGALRQALQDPMLRGKTIWFRKEGDAVICEW